LTVPGWATWLAPALNGVQTAVSVGGWLVSVLLNLEVNDLRQRMGRLLGESDSESPQAPGSWAPAVDVSEDAVEIVLYAELPGMTKRDIDIQVAADSLKLSGERRPQELQRGEHYQRIERSYGAFHRIFRINTPIDVAGVTASYEAGILTVRLPKVTAAKPRQITIETHVTKAGPAAQSR